MGKGRRSLVEEGPRSRTNRATSERSAVPTLQPCQRFSGSNTSERVSTRLIVLSEILMPKQAASQDARLILELYRLRRETQMRKARHWWLSDFWPENAGDYLKVEMARKTPQSDWLRQVLSYWGMAASFVIHGTLSKKVFLDASFSTEMFFIFAKVQPFLRELRHKTLNPDLMGNIEKVIMESKTGRMRLKQVSKRVERRRKSQRAKTKKERKGPELTLPRSSAATSNSRLPQTIATRSHTIRRRPARNKRPVLAT